MSSENLNKKINDFRKRTNENIVIYTIIYLKKQNIYKNYKIKYSKVKSKNKNTEPATSNEHTEN